MGAAETQTEITQAKLDELERQTEMLEEQVKKQTKLLLEQSILESDAYREGFNLENLAESDGDFDPVTSNRHRVNIMFDYGGKVYIENAVPGFITPRLRDAYLIGLRDRLKQDFSKPIELNLLERLVFLAGKNRTSLEAQELSGRFIFATYRLELGTDRFIDIHTPKIALGIKYETDLSTGKVIAHVESRHTFNNRILDDAFNKGFQEYLQSINNEDSCNKRLSLYQKRVNLRNEAIARNAGREKRYLIASADWRKSKSTKFQLEIFIKLIGAIPIYFLWESDHGIIAGIYLLLYLIFIFVPFASSLQADPPTKESPERLPFVCDPIYEAFGEFYNGEDDFLYGRAVAIVLEKNRASASLLQRHLRMGYNRALNLIETMESVGIVSKPDYEGKRAVLI